MDIGLQSPDGQTPFLRAFRARSLKVLDYLVERRVNTNVVVDEDRNALAHAAFIGDAELVAVLLKNPDEDANRADWKLGWTPLIWAAYRGHREVCRLLVERGANVNKVTKHKFSPRLAAINNEFLDVDRFLEQHGAKYHPPGDD